MKKYYMEQLIFIFLVSGYLLIPKSSDAGSLTRQKPIVIKVELGNNQDAYKFFPDSFNIETGKLYRLVLHNPSPRKHYFSSDRFSSSIFTRKLKIIDQKHKALAEVNGYIREVGVSPKQTVEWWFIPIKSGMVTDLKCTISDHADMGMVGTIIIE